jgi:hypothetical protein
MSSRRQTVEKALGVRVPAQYEVFLITFGDYEARGIQVFGITDDTMDMEKMPCVIGATKIRRRFHGLPHRFIVLHYTGMEDEFICLDTEDEKVYSISRLYGNHKIADSFDEWFARDILGQK